MNKYIQRQAIREALISESPSSGLGMVVVIPCFNEPDLTGSLESLLACERPQCDVEVIVIVNSSANAQQDELDANLASMLDFEGWNARESNNGIRFFLIHENNLDPKHAGVGLARKIGMDEAVRRLDLVKTDGIIVCYDADCRCESNYLVEIEKHFRVNPKTVAASIQFEHPLVGSDYLSEIYQAITQYELHLRCYRLGLVYAGHPHSYHTVGSSMALRSSAYQKVGGMNRRQAGEDFYFLQKIIASAGITEINSTTVIPSPRGSNRVPFGTGKAVKQSTENNEFILTYAPEIYDQTLKLTSIVELLYTDGLVAVEDHLDKLLLEFLVDANWELAVEEVRSNTTNLDGFTKRFYRWFNAFKALKFVHFARDNKFANVSVTDAAVEILRRFGVEAKGTSEIELLLQFRELERTQILLNQKIVLSG